MKEIKTSLRSRITALILILTVIPLLCTGIFIAHRIYRDQLQQATRLQSEVAKWVDNELHCLLREIEEKIIFASKTNNLLEMNDRQRNITLSKLRSSFTASNHADVIEDIMLFDDKLKLLALASRTSIAQAFSEEELHEIRLLFGTPLRQKTMYSPIRFCQQAMAPIMMLSIPIIEYNSGTVKGLIVACVRMNSVWEAAVRIPVGRTGTAFVAAADGQIIAHSNPSLVISDHPYNFANHDLVQLNRQGDKVIRVNTKVEIGQQDFFIVVERPFKEAFDLTYSVLISLILSLVFFLTIGVVLGLLAARKIVKPIEQLAETAERIKAGALECRAEVAGTDEIGFLAETFNSMTTQLISDIKRRKKAEETLKEHQAELENKVDMRTAELQNANLSLYKEIKDRIAAEEKLTASLTEKEVLLKEIHHRVKNNMQIISSLLFLQSQNTDSPETLGVIRQSIDRIKTMTLIHEKLYNSSDFAKIDVDDYIRTITSHMQGTYNNPDKKINCQVDIEKVFLPLDITIPCGLILNELLTNCYKYAFESKDSGEIRVSLQRAEDNKLILMVSDNGVGLPEKNGDAEPTTLGMSLIESLTGQIDGTCEFSSNQGAQCKIIFELPG